MQLLLCSQASIGLAHSSITDRRQERLRPVYQVNAITRPTSANSVISRAGPRLASLYAVTVAPIESPITLCWSEVSPELFTLVAGGLSSSMYFMLEQSDGKQTNGRYTTYVYIVTFAERTPSSAAESHDEDDETRPYDVRDILFVRIFRRKRVLSVHKTGKRIVVLNTTIRGMIPLGRMLIYKLWFSATYIYIYIYCY